MELLKPDGWANAKRVYATAHGISKSDCEVVRSQIEKFFDTSLDRVYSKIADRIQLRPDLECKGFFDEYWRSLKR